jgi:hypothetical protein
MEARAYSDSNKFGERPRAAAFHDPCPMDLDGSVAYPEIVGNRFMLLAIRQQREHLKFSFAEFV